MIQICPNLEYAFQILGRKWNGLILHYLSLAPDGEAHFSDMKRDLPEITPRALSMKLVELQAYGLIEKHVKAGTPIHISYQLTARGRSLTEALKPVQQWAQQHREQA